jgi:hypothetical protein
MTCITLSRALDSFHAQSWIVEHFSLALKNRLEGQAASFLLSKELEVKAEESMRHAKNLLNLEEIYK